MSRPLRIEYPGALYHVTSRGNRREAIYRDDEDRECFLRVLSDVCGTFGWVVHSYCLMDNHYHLVVETPDANLSAGMRELNGVYTMRFNRRHGAVGHLFQGRFKAFLVEKDAYFLELCRYVVLNPVRAGMVVMPQDWKWSSFRKTIQTVPPPDFLDTPTTLAYFSSEAREAMRRYEQFVLNGIGKASPLNDAKGGILCSDAFRETISAKSTLPETESPKEVPRRERYFERMTLEEKFSRASGNMERNRLVRSARRMDGYSVREIAQHLGLHYSTVSKIIHADDGRRN